MQGGGEVRTHLKYGARLTRRVATPAAATTLRPLGSRVKGISSHFIPAFITAIKKKNPRGGGDGVLAYANARRSQRTFFPLLFYRANEQEKSKEIMAGPAVSLH